MKDMSIDYTDNYPHREYYEVSELQPLAAAKINQQNKSSHSPAKSSSPQVKEIKTKLCANIVKTVRETDCLYKLIPQMTFIKEIMKAFLNLSRLKYWFTTRLLRKNRKNGKNSSISATIVLNQAYKS